MCVCVCTRARSHGHPRVRSTSQVRGPSHTPSPREAGAHQSVCLLKPPVEVKLGSFPEVASVLGSARRVGATSRPAGLSGRWARCPSRTCDSSRVPLRGPTSGLRRLPEWPGQPSPERGNAGVQKGLLAEMGAVGARGGAKEGRQEWEEVGSGAPGQGARRGAGTGVRVSQRSSRTSGWQPALPGHVPCLPMGTLHPAPGLAGRPPLRCTHSTGVSHTLCPNQGTQQLPEQEPRADLHRCCPASPAPLVGSELTALVCSRHPSVLLSLSHPPDLQGRA